MKKQGTMAALSLLMGLGMLTASPGTTSLAPYGKPVTAQQAQVAAVAEVPAGFMPAAAQSSSRTVASDASQWRMNVMQGAATKGFIAPELTASSPMRNFVLPGKKAATTSQMAGEYVMTYSSLVSTLGSGGLCVNIEALGTDSILIKNFWAESIDVRAGYNAATGAITIPAQFLYTHPTYGAMWLGMCSSSGTPVYDTPLTGSISADGVLSIDTWWGVFVKEGENAGSYMMVAYNTAFQRTNASMSADIYPEGSEKYGVIVNQTAENQITVANFGNYGLTVRIDLNRFYSGRIGTEAVREYPQNGASFVAYATGGYTTNASGGVALQSLTTPIYLDTLANQKVTRQLSWGNWTAVSTGTSSYFLRPWTSGKIESTVDITFPVLDITEFKGSGTLDDPYQIATRNDLILLSQKVEESTEVNPRNPAQVRAFEGKYFKVMNDIDMSNYKFTPIGPSYTKRFGGIFDGGNHTISNLFVEREDYYAGLFGLADTTAVLKNVILTNPDISNTSHYAAALVSWTYGDVDNCHVSGGTVIANGQVVGGLAGSVNGSLTNSTATGVSVAGASGWTGGLVGQVVGGLRNCSATSMVVRGYPGSGTAFGGLAGMILCDCENLYFEGLMDGYSLGAPSSGSTGIVTGGITGMLNSSTMKNAFAVGTVMGRNSYCEVGGLVGRAQSATIENAYFRGRVGSYYSRTTGGLTGRVVALSNDGKPVTNNFRNLYVAAYEDLEDYQYDRVTGWAETLGKVEDGALGTVENVYYNRQLFTENSENGTPLYTFDFTSGNLPAGFDASVWTTAKGQYPVLKSFEQTEAANLSASAVCFTDSISSLNFITHNTKLTAKGNTQFLFYRGGRGYKQGYNARIDGDSLIVEKVGVDTLMFVNGTTNFYYIVRMAPMNSFAGSGSASDPFQIRTKEQLIQLSHITTDDKQYFPGVYFRQMNDIDLELDPDFIGIASDPADAHSRFAGIYDGGGHTIHRMKLRGLIWKTPPTETSLGVPLTTGGSFGYQGFMGRLDVDGVLRNLNFDADCDATEVWASTGVAVGDNYGLVQNVRNYADIVAVSCWVGGVCGMNEAEGRIIDCYNAGNVTSGYNSAGGVTGRNNGAIENCANAGDVTIARIAQFGSNYNVCGGITTSMSGGYVKNVLNVGRVSATGPAVGGIVGNLYNIGSTTAGPGKNDVIGAVTYATVRSGELATLGAVAGRAASNVAVSSPTQVLAYYDDQISPCFAYANEAFTGFNALSTAALTSGNALEGLDTQYWQFDAGMYPTLKTFADEPKLAAARKLILSLPEGVTVRDLTAGGTLSGGTWSVDPATYFGVNGNNLTVGGTPAQVENAVLTGTLNGFSKPIDLKRIPAVPMQGSGTKDDPYLIPSTAVWNEVADYINATNDQFEGKYIKVTSDLDFTSTTFKPFFKADAALLSGTLNGDGHTVTIAGYTPDGTYQGPIRTIGADGVLQNFIFKGTINSTKTYCGAVTGRVYGTVRNVTSEINISLSTGSAVAAFGTAYANARFEKCVNKGTITAPSTYVGGLVSVANANVTFIECGNEGVIKSTFVGNAPTTAQSIGGLAGSAISAKMYRCYNTGSFDFAKPASMFGVGGLIGWARSATANTDTTVLEGCYNTATIEVGWSAAGLIANMDGTATLKNYIHVRDCYNTGDMILVQGTASKTSSGVAGLLLLYAPGTEILNSYNTGAILNNNPKQAYAAGIVAYYKVAPTAAEPMLVAGCYNTGEVSSVYNYAAGIQAYIGAYTRIVNCYNTGNVSSAIGAAGIGANLSNLNSCILNSWNSGNISASVSRAGGISAQNTVKSTISDCFNTGIIAVTAESVTANATTKQATAGYGAGGIVGEGGGFVRRCYNVGIVKGLANVGGIIGRPSKNITVLTQSYNAGEFVAPADTCGSLIGIDFTTAGRLWNAETNRIDSCYYLDAKLPHETYGKALTQTELIDLNMGQGWTSAIPYTYPMLTVLDNDMARLWAAQVVLKESDALQNVIKGSFFVGVPEGVSWMPSISNLTLDGNKYIWGYDAYKGFFTLTAACGPYTRVVTLEADKPVSVDGIDADEADIIKEMWYTTQGILVPRPAERDGQIYVVVRYYSDGTRRTLRLRN